MINTLTRAEEYIHAATVLIDLGEEWRTASRLCHKALHHDENSDWAFFFLAITEAQRGKTKLAKAHFETDRIISTHRPELLFSKGELLSQKHALFNEAEKYYRDAILPYNHQIRSWRGCGSIDLSNNDYKNASAQFKAVQDFADTASGLYSNRAYCCMMAGRYEEAIELYKSAFILDGDIETYRDKKEACLGLLNEQPPIDEHTP